MLINKIELGTDTVTSDSSYLKIVSLNKPLNLTLLVQPSIQQRGTWEQLIIKADKTGS